jgi:hypothetical protein
VGLDLNSPVVTWSDDVSDFSMQKDFVFGGMLNCCLELLYCSLNSENYSEIVETIARDVFNVDGEVNVSEAEYEVVTSFKFGGVEHNQTHIFAELTTTTVAHLTVFSNILETDGELLRTFLNSLITKAKVLDDTRSLDMLSFALI